MTPEKIKLQQQVVKEAVEKEVNEKGLAKSEAAQLLKTTLLVRFNNKYGTGLQ